MRQLRDVQAAKKLAVFYAHQGTGVLARQFAGIRRQVHDSRAAAAGIGKEMVGWNENKGRRTMGSAA